MVYNFKGYIEEENFSDFLIAYNSCLESEDKALTIYLCSGGGSSDYYQPMLDMINSKQLDITLVAHSEICSYGFLLFYNAKTNKKLLPLTLGMVHEVSQEFPTRYLKKNDLVTRKQLQNLEQENVETLAILENALKKHDRRARYLKGEDVFFNGKDLEEIMSKCPYGKLIK